MNAVEKRFEKGRRVPVVDAVRGVMIVYVSLYHLLYDLVLFGLVPAAVLYHPAVEVTHFISYSVFVAFSGVSSRFSRNNFRRGAQMLGIACVISLVTWVLDHEAFVRFGILHFLGVAALLFWGMEKLWGLARAGKPALSHGFLRVWNFVFPVVMLAVYGLTHRFVYRRAFPAEGLAWLGFPGPAYHSTDYFPMVPFFFLYLFGTWLGRMITEGKLPAWFYRINIPGFDKLGRHTLWIYLAHQPVFYSLVWLFATLR